MRCVHLAARIARYVWAAPCTAVGLCLVAPAFLFGASARVVDGAIEVALSAFKSSNFVLGALPFNAITTLNSTRMWRSQSEFWYQRSSHCSS